MSRERISAQQTETTVAEQEQELTLAASHVVSDVSESTTCSTKLTACSLRTLKTSSPASSRRAASNRRTCAPGQHHGTPYFRH